MKLPLLILLLFLSSELSFSQIPEFSWVVPYLKSKRMSTDSKGNLIIAGGFYSHVNLGPINQYSLDSEGAADIFIQKLDSTGAVVWLKTISSELGEGVGGLSIDEDDNIYITGQFFGTLDFDPGPGTFELTPTYSYGGYGDTFYMKLNADGELLWARTFGARVFDDGTIIQVDQQQNVYIAGNFQDGINDMDPGNGVYTLPCYGYSDIYVVKIDPQGNLVWGNSFGGSYIDHLSDMVVDEVGNVYLTGNFKYSGMTNTGVLFENNSNSEIFLLKYLSSGELDWGYSLSSDGNHGAGKLALDSNGNLLHSFFTSDTTDINNGFDSYFIPPGNYIQKRTPTGSLIWIKKVPFSFNAIVVDANDSIFLAGGFTGTVNFGDENNPEIHTYNGYGTNSSAYLGKFDALLNPAWVATINSGETSSFWQMSLDKNRNIYLGGVFSEVVDFDWSEGVSEMDYNYAEGFILRLGDNVEHKAWIYPTHPYTGEELETMTINPNPTTGILTISQSVNNKYSLLVYDYLGRILQTMQTEDLQTTIDLSNYSTGMYTIKVKHGENVNTWKIVKNN